MIEDQEDDIKDNDHSNTEYMDVDPTADETGANGVEDNNNGKDDPYKSVSVIAISLPLCGSLFLL